MKLKTRLTICIVGIAIIFLFVLIYKSGQEASRQLIQTEVGLLCDGTKVTYYVDEKGIEYVQFGDGKIEVVK